MMSSKQYIHSARTRRRAAQAGLSLVEMLVSVAIFVTIMGTISLLFNGSLRAMKQGQQNQEAFEVARGALSLFEKDLTLAFTSREHGDHFEFYGTPIGLTFVGYIRFHEDDDPNLARITYVIRRDAATTQVLRDIDDSLNYTYSLVRLIERNADELESFPVDWDTLLIDGSGFTINEIIGDPAVGSSPLPPATFIDEAVNRGLCADDDLECLQQVQRSVRRELWIRMLAGTDETVLPDIWASMGRDPADYVLAENILYVDQFDPTSQLPGVQRPFLLEADTASLAEQRWSFFRYGGRREQEDLLGNGFIQSLELAFWNDWRNMDLDFNGIDDDGDNLVLETNAIDDDGNNAAWEVDGIDNDDDGTIDEANEGVDEPNEGVDEGGEFAALGVGGVGSPYVPRLPDQVVANFTIMFESPIAGAPDFERDFELKIDVPGAYRRVTLRQ